MEIAIIGCGLIGKKRANSLRKEDNIAVVCDTKEAIAKSFSQTYQVPYVVDWQEVANYPVDAVVIATTHNTLAEISHYFLQKNIHILVEKPAARNWQELKPVYDTYLAKKQDGVVARVGFNHRFHPAMLKAKEILSDPSVGENMFIRGRYGHGGRIGYDKEWRAKPQVSGGGELLDQGMHLIDLSRWYFGDFNKVQGIAQTFYWDMPVDDNAFLTLQSGTGQVSQLHVTWTEWKNLFSLEIYTRNVKLHIEGLGGSYGTERLAYYHMKPEMGPPDTLIYEYPGADQSWQREWLDFVAATEGKASVGGTLADALQALQIVKTVYEQNPQIKLD
ncbi:MAG: Gfo/Idh/MocA family oxidoreductase [Spirochaetota bacterium]